MKSEEKGRFSKIMQGNTLHAPFLRSAGVQAATVVFQFLLSIVLARGLGPSGYGIYAFAIAIMTLLLVVATAGVPTLLMREVAVAESRNAWGLMRGAILRSIQFVFFVSSGITLVGLTILYLSSNRIEPESRYTFALMLLLLPLVAITKTIGHALRGLERVVLAQVLEMLARVVLATSFVVILFYFTPELRAPRLAMAAQLIAALFVAIAAAVLLWRVRPKEVSKHSPVFQTRYWLTSTLPFALIGGALVINSQTDLVMMGWFVAPEEVGTYRIAMQGALFVGVSLQVVSAVISPKLARLKAQGDTALLQKAVTRAVRIVSIPAVTIAFLLIFEGHALLTWIFGPEYQASYGPLVVLTIGQLVTVVLGVSGPLLSMTGFEAQVSKTVWISAIVNIALNFMLIPFFGGFGAAIATTSTLMAWSIYLTWFSYRRLGIIISPIENNRFRIN